MDGLFPDSPPLQIARNCSGVRRWKLPEPDKQDGLRFLLSRVVSTLSSLAVDPTKLFFYKLTRDGAVLIQGSHDKRHFLPPKLLGGQLLSSSFSKRLQKGRICLDSSHLTLHLEFSLGLYLTYCESIRII